MKYYFIAYHDILSDSITLYEEFHTETDAVNSLEKCSLKYIKKAQGKKQLANCTRNEMEIINDTAFFGMFIVKEGNRIILKEKALNIIPGLMWNSHEMKITKLGSFTVVQHDISDTKSCNCNLSYTSSVASNHNDLFLKELKERLAQIENNFGLKKPM